MNRFFRELGPLAVFVACSLALHGPGLFGGPLAWERDTILFYQPLTDWFAEQLRAGRLPLWLPTTFSGYALLADGEVGPLYPLNLLVLPLLPTGTAFVLLAALHSVIGASLTYALLRVLGVGRLGALLAGLVFSLGSFMVGQLQHENMIRSAVWLPGLLLTLELALRRRGWARQRWLLLGGLGFGCACLGLHLQAVVMSLLALGLYALCRLALGPFNGSRLERLLLLVWAPGLITALGLALAAAQWLPLAELGRTSFRGPGLSYALATTYALPPFNLPALLFPYFFRGQDSRWWSLWAPWETLPYAGIAPLALVILGLISRRRPVVFFALLAASSLWTALAQYVPLNLHELLWHLPGVSSLRAPGRFAYLFVFGIAGLAAFGLDAILGAGARWSGEGERGTGLLSRLRHRHCSAATGALCILTALALPIIFQLASRHLLADSGRGQQAAELRYLALPHQDPDLEPYQVYDGLLYSLSLANPKTLLTLGLLAGTGLLLLGCWRWPGRTPALAAGLVGLTAADLLVFALDYHPRATMAELTALPAVATWLGANTGDEHIFVEPVLERLEPNRLVLARARDLNGYSSLQSQRHYEYASSVDRTDNLLLDLWNGRYYVVPARRTDVMVFEGTALRPYEALVSGGMNNPTGRERFTIEPFPSGEVRVLAALTNAISIEQGTTVAEITLSGANGRHETIPLRAGIDLSEHAFDRADLQNIVAHGRARVVGGLPDQAPNGLRFQSNIYASSFPLSPSFEVSEIDVRYVASEGFLRLWGLGLVKPGTTQVRSLFADDRAKYEHPPLYRDDEALVYRNSEAFPRAYVVPEVLARRTRQEETAIARLALRPFNPRRQAVFEEGPFDDVPVAAEPIPDDGSEVPPVAAELVELSPEHLQARASGPGGLVFTDAYHRGWRAYLDGDREVPVYLANYVGRGVGLPPGEHTVDLVFDPLSWRIGKAISFAAISFVLLVLLISFLAGRLRDRAEK
jgi:hypothetical protein